MTDAPPDGRPPAQPAPPAGRTAQAAQAAQAAQPTATTPGTSAAQAAAPAQTAPPVQAGQLAAAGRRRPPRRRHPWRTAFFAVAATAIVAAVAWALFGGRLFTVRSISVSGTHLVTQSQVLAAADVPLGTPLLNVNAGAVASRVEAIRQVASATVTKDWPDHLAITVTERVPAISIRMAGGGYDLVDGTGVIVRWTRAKPEGLPVFQTSLTGAALRGDPGVAAVAAVLGELDPWLAVQVVTVTATPVLTGDGGAVVQAQQVTLVLRNGTTVLWGQPGDAAQKNRELQIVLKNKVRDVDASAPGTVVTR
jgi:cell division protein FtsQ